MGLPQARPYFLEALRGTNFSLQTLTKALVQADLLRIVRVAKEEEKFFRNLNEPTDTNSVS